MDFLYFLVKGSATYGVEHDPIGFLKNYFETDGAFTTSFIYALVVALAGLFIFYGIFGMKIYKLSKPVVYWIMFAVVGVVTFILTQLMIVGGKAAQSGFFASTQAKFEEYVTPLGNDQIAQAAAFRENIENEMDGFCSAVTMLNLTNIAIALILFFLISLGIKGFTIQAKKVPF